MSTSKWTITFRFFTVADFKKLIAVARLMEFSPCDSKSKMLFDYPDQIQHYVWNNNWHVVEFRCVPGMGRHFSIFSATHASYCGVDVSSLRLASSTIEEVIAEIVGKFL